MERSLLGSATLVAAAWCRAGMRPEAGPRGKSAECSDHGQSGGRTGVVSARTLLAGCRPPPAGPPERSDPGRWRFRCSRPRNRNRSVYDISRRQGPNSWPGWGRSFRSSALGCGGDIRLRGDGRQEPAHFEPDVRKRAKSRMASPAYSQPLTHLGEPLEPPPVSPARGPPTEWGELVQAHFRRGNHSGDG